MQPFFGDQMAYEIHTRHELDFMLTRGKPLAHFCDGYPPEPDEEIVPRRAFAPYVASGRFVERFYVELTTQKRQTLRIRGVLHAFYAQSDEEWRIDRYIDMQAEGMQLGWGERLERLQGTLLGYTEYENDLHIERSLKNPANQSWPWVKEALASRVKT